MKMSELQNLTVKELNQMLEEKRKEYGLLRIEVKMSKSNAFHTVKNLKADVAKILTQINKLRLEGQK